jgi:hypothetical protein
MKKLLEYGGRWGVSAQLRRSALAKTALLSVELRMLDSRRRLASKLFAVFLFNDTLFLWP